MEGLGDLSMLSPDAVKKLVKDQLFPGWSTERDRLERVDCWYRWKQEEIPLPRKATQELRKLAALSKVPWLGLVVTAVAQAMYVDGYRSKLDPHADGADGVWTPYETWQANGMERRQVAVHRAALAYGQSFLRVLPGVNPLTGEPQAVMRGVSPRKGYALWEDAAEDDWPRYFMQVLDDHGDRYRVRVLDETASYELTVEDTGSKVEDVGTPQVHDVGVCPVVRFANMLDLEGRVTGEVEPFIPIAARINKTSYDRLLTQHFASWKVRTVTGMVEGAQGEADGERMKLQLRQDDILIAEDVDTKFGTLDATPLDGFIAAHKHDVETLAAVTQTPTHELTGALINMSAEALAAARASLNQKVTERQKSFGASYAQSLRLASAIDGHDDYAADPTGRVTWQDMEIRSLSQAVDAYGKASVMLGVPGSALWGRIPGVERADTEEWKRIVEEGDPITRMQMELQRQVSDTQQDTLTAGFRAGGDGRH